MRYDMQSLEGYIVSITTSNQGIEEDGNITASRYEEILSVIQNKPQDEDGYEWWLREDLTWERREVPEQTEDDSTGYTEDELLAMTNAELERILATYGLTATANKSNMIRLILYMQGGGADA